jgi:hypothetical protein
MAMICVQLFLPLTRRDSPSRRRRLIADVQRELTDEFGGVTAFINAPAEGAWRKAQRTVRDEIIVIEVMVKHLHRAWWKRYKRELERRFVQDVIIVRAIRMEML